MTTRSIVTFEAMTMKPRWFVGTFTRAPTIVNGFLISAPDAYVHPVRSRTAPEAAASTLACREDPHAAGSCRTRDVCVPGHPTSDLV